MSKSKVSNQCIDTYKNNNLTPKKTKNQDKNNSLISLNNKEENRSKSCYKTPYNSKNVDISYSKMEMPISYQLTNGKCVRLRDSQRSREYYGYNFENEMNNNASLKVASKSSNTSQINNSFMINNNQKERAVTKGNNSLFNYGKSFTIYPMKFIKHHQKKLFKDESQKEWQIDKIDNEIKSYKKFNLMINPSYKYNKKFISSPIHKYLPYCKKNDEKYKKNLILYIRNEAQGQIGGAKSVSCVFAKYAKNNNNEKPKEDDIQFFLMKKKKKIYSTKKIFSAEKELYNYCLIDGKNRVDYKNPKKFRFFFDNDIGFNYSWQSPLILANGDDDVETDDEVLNMAEEKCMDDLVEGINAWNKSSRLCRNFVLAKKFNRIVKTPTFNSIMQIKKNINNEKKIENQKKNSKIYCNESIYFNNVSFRK